MRYLSLFYALYLLNLSVDAPDISGQQHGEDLSINDQESLAELVIEHLLGFEDAIDEYDEQDSEEVPAKKAAKLDLKIRIETVLSHCHQSAILEKALMYFRHWIMPSNVWIDVDSPPPQWVWI